MTASRHFEPCKCRYQRKKNWGYDVQRYTGNATYWNFVGTARDVSEAKIMAEGFRTVLIRCNGCGSDMVREYPEKVVDPEPEML